MRFVASEKTRQRSVTGPGICPNSRIAIDPRSEQRNEHIFRSVAYHLHARASRSILSFTENPCEISIFLSPSKLANVNRTLVDLDHFLNTSNRRVRFQNPVNYCFPHYTCDISIRTIDDEMIRATSSKNFVII
uniref:Uncharacterized protein n=1 Tax=Caenorhabditis japonica TaxID=281687 RepID=A0A8R1IS96_CAEJA